MTGRERAAPCPRPVRAKQIDALLEDGLTSREISVALKLSYSAVRSIINDPHGAKQKKRRERYRLPCPRCGRLMDASSGLNGRRVPKRCSSCLAFELRSIPLVHGTRNGYERGCRCRPCRDAQAAYIRIIYANGKKKSYPVPLERSRAYAAVRKAIKDGTIVVPDQCQNPDCGAAMRRTHDGSRWLQAHHDDYNKPLDVVFVCVPCHKQLHKKAASRG